MSFSILDSTWLTVEPRLASTILLVPCVSLTTMKMCMSAPLAKWRMPVLEANTGFISTSTMLRFQRNFCTWQNIVVLSHRCSRQMLCQLDGTHTCPGRVIRHWPLRSLERPFEMLTNLAKALGAVALIRDHMALTRVMKLGPIKDGHRFNGCAKCSLLQGWLHTSHCYGKA